MLIVGLCGGSGSGKGTVSLFFNKEGIPSIDTDKVYRDLTYKNSPLLLKLASEFGNGIISKDGTLDRKELGNIVFTDASGLLLKKLNSITHSAIIDETEKIISDLKKQSFNAVIVDAPLLFESGFDKKCDFIIAVVAPEEERIMRITKRDGIDKSAAKKRIDTQIPDEVLRERAHFIIENDGDLEKAEAAVKEICKKLI